MTELTPVEPPDEDDGFRRSTSGRAVGTYLKWTDTLGWVDRDGLAPPALLLVGKLNDFLRRWKDGQPTDIDDKPLPDPEQLNSAIPQSEWEMGKDGKPRPPWHHTVGIYLIDPATGNGYRYEHDTVGAHMCWDELREAVINMRLLRGDKCLPLVRPSEKPWKVPTGLRKRPFLEILGWKTPGGDRAGIPAKPVPRLSGPAVAPVAASPAAPAATSQATTTSPPSNPSTQPYQAKPKPPVNLTSETLAAMDEVRPATTSEILNDELPF
jgi:hypothetical protein